MVNPIYQQGEELMLNPFGSKYLGVAAHTNVNSNEFIVQEDAVISVLTGGDSSIAANDVDYKASMSLSGVTLKQGALIVAPQGESFQSMTIDSGTIMAYNSVVGGTKPSAAPLLLDLYPDAAAAYSLRKLRDDYTGPAIEARKTVTGVSSTQDIGFVNGELDTVLLLSFANGGDGFVSKWYDQSGNGNDVTQASESAQPKIVSGGVVETLNNKPTINASGSVLSSIVTTFTDANGQLTTFGVLKPTSASNGVFISNRNSGTLLGNFPKITTVTTFQNLSFNSPSGFTQSQTSFTLNTTNLVTCFRRTSNLQNYVNGVADSAVPSGTPLNGTTSLSIFSRNSSITEPFIGYGSEVILYPSDQSTDREGIENNINTHYTIY